MPRQAKSIVLYLLSSAVFYWNQNAINNYSGVKKFKNPLTYDFIIIGGGTAGSALAARLSEISHLTVLVLEAGGATSIYSDIPLIMATLKTTPIIKPINTTKQRTACARGD